MPDIGKINSVAIGSISKVNNQTFSDSFKILGITKAAAGGTATNFLGQQSNWVASSGKAGLGFVPTGWQTNTTDTVFSSTTADRQWTSDTGGTTPSSGTGPTAGHNPLQGINGNGSEGSSTVDYIYTEATSQFNKRMLLRTPELDFTNALSNNTLKLYFWFHMFGSNMGSLGVAATDNSTSAGDTTLGLHFTGDTTGGATITFWDDNSDDGSSTSSAVRISGQQQTQGHGNTSTDAHWRLGVVDLNSVAGQSSVYIWFFGKTGGGFRSDMAIDDVLVVGEE